MKVIVDSREHLAYKFEHPRYEVAIETQALQTGDYSIAGLTDRVAVERKSLPDLVACLGRDRARFERELQRASSLDAFAVIIEASWADLAQGNYQSKLHPHAACQSVLAFSARYRIPFLFVGSRDAGEYAAWGFLRQYLEGARKRLQAINAAHAA